MHAQTQVSLNDGNNDDINSFDHLIWWIYMIVLSMRIASPFPCCPLSAELWLPQQEELQTWLW